MKKYCTYSPTFPKMLTYLFFFNIITVINSYFVDAVSLLCLITIRKKQKGQGQGILITRLILWDFKSSSFLPCIDIRHIVL